MHLGNPIFKNRFYILNYVIIWAIVIVAHIFIVSYYYQTGLFIAISDSLLFNVLFAVTGLLVWFPSKFIKIENHNRFVVIFNHFLIAIIITGIWLSFGYNILKWIYSENSNYIEFLYSSLPGRFLLGVMYYAGISMIYYILIFYNSLQEKTLRETELKGKVKEAEMNMLKFQLNPHFIFNSLNSINSLTLISPEKARNMIIKLSDFLRYSLQHDGNQLSTFESELNNIENYLSIEKIRFGDRLEYTKLCTPDYLGFKIPSLILQPIFENAIKHGVNKSTDKVNIHLNCQLEDTFFVIEVRNNFDPEFVTQSGIGIGLKNIAERLKIIYNKRNLLEIKREKNCFEIRLYIPCDMI